MNIPLRQTVLSSLVVSLVSAGSPIAQERDSEVADRSSTGGYVLGPGEGEDMIGDGSLLIKASPRSGTQGAVLVVDRMPPSSTSGIHRHIEADEFFHVLQGSGRIRLGSEEQVIGPGETIFVPAGTNHRITSSEDDPLHVIFLVDRPGLDEQFRAEFSGLDRAKMTLEEFNAVVEKYGTVYETFE